MIALLRKYIARARLQRMVEQRRNSPEHLRFLQRRRAALLGIARKEERA